MATQESTTVQTDTWTKCYGSSWNGIICNEAFSHPAKYSRALIQRLYQHVREEGWLQPGDTVLDTFGGVALGAYDAIRQGYHYVGIELEQAFLDLGQGCDCPGISTREWVQFYGRWPRVRYRDGRHWCPACMAQTTQTTGERQLSRRTFSTRPRGDRPVKTGTVPFAPLPFPDRRDGVKPPRPQSTLALFASATAAYERGSGRIPHTMAHHFEGNIERWAREGYTGATLLQGDSRYLQTVLSKADLCVSSPPYSSGTIHDTGQASQTVRQGSGALARPWGTRKDGDSLQRYGQSPAQLGNLRHGSVEACLSSPPYANGLGKEETYADQGGAVHQVAYGESAGQVAALPSGSVDSVISSPPWENQEGSKGAHKFKDPAAFAASMSAHNNGHSASPEAYLRDFERQAQQTYGTHPDQLGNTHGTTFWKAAFAIVSQVFAVLKPGGVAIWVVKSYVRDGQLVDFPGDWEKLCRHVGFVTLHEHHALLTEHHGTQRDLHSGADVVQQTQRVSFFRRLAEKKGSPPILWETVYCMRKPVSAGPLPPDEAWEQLALVDGCDAVLSSPPYAGTPIAACEGNMGGGTGGRIASALTNVNGNIKHVGYGTTSGQLGAMPAGQPPDCVMASPPYADSWHRADSTAVAEARMRRAGYADAYIRDQFWTSTAGGGNLNAQAYGTTPGQLGAMPAGTPPDCIIASPPYAGAGEVLGGHNGIDFTKAAAPTGGRLTPGRQMYTYGTTAGQLGSMPAGQPPAREG